MKPKEGVLKNIILSSEKIQFGIDYLRLKIDNVNSPLIKEFKRLSSLLDYDNSNFATYEDLGYTLTFQKVKLSNGKGLIFSYSFYGIAIPILVILEYHSNHKKLFNSWGKLDFYGSFFRLKELGEFENYLFGSFLDDYEITRLDYRLDFFNYKGKTISEKIINNNINTRYQCYKTKGIVTSWRFGNKDNKNLLVRGYDKKLDIGKKGKFRLYSDYNQYDNIFRLEWEFLNLFCKGYKLKDIEDFVEIKVKSYIGLSEKDFTGKYMYSYNKLDLSNEFQKTRYCKMMSAYILEALKNEINVYDFVDIELEKLGLCKKDIEKIRNKSNNIKGFNLLTK